MEVYSGFFELTSGNRSLNEMALHHFNSHSLQMLECLLACVSSKFSTDKW
jgi:hypothetical protein